LEAILALAATKMETIMWNVVRVYDSNRTAVDATAAASIRWWSSFAGGQIQVKGAVTLERFASTPLFRIKYQGQPIGSEGERLERVVRGALYLPVDVAEPTVVSYDFLESTNAKAHGIRLDFGANDDGIEKIQIVVPASDSNDASGVLLKESIDFAESYRLAYIRGEVTFFGQPFRG